MDNENNKQERNIIGAIIEKSVVICENVKIYPNVFLLGKTTIKSGCEIYPGTTIIDSEIGENCKIKNSYIENSVVKNNVSIGPFAHLRPNCVIFDNATIGNFVEIKNSKVGEKTKVSHLAYVGDSDIGRNCNIGCGAIFVNYNGKTKNRIQIGDNCFIGSNCNLIAPISVADETYVCAGTTLSVSTEKDDFVIGRCREIIKKNRAHKYLSQTMNL